MNFKKIYITVLTLLISFGFSYASELLFDQAITYYNEAVRAQKKGDFTQAMSNYQKAMFLMGTGERNYKKFVLNNVAVIYAEEGDFENAAITLLQALKIDPDYKEANFNMAILYFKSGMVKEGLEYIEKLTNRAELFVISEELQLPLK